MRPAGVLIELVPRHGRAPGRATRATPHPSVEGPGAPGRLLRVATIDKKGRLPLSDAREAGLFTPGQVVFVTPGDGCALVRAEEPNGRLALTLMVDERHRVTVGEALRFRLGVGPHGRVVVATDTVGASVELWNADVVERAIRRQAEGRSRFSHGRRCADG